MPRSSHPAIIVVNVFLLPLGLVVLLAGVVGLRAMTEMWWAFALFVVGGAVIFGGAVHEIRAWGKRADADERDRHQMLAAARAGHAAPAATPGARRAIGPVLAHWTYDYDEWRAWADAEMRYLAREALWMFATVAVGGTLLVGALEGEWKVALVIALGTGGAIGAGRWLMAWLAHRRNRAVAAGEVIVGPRAMLVNGRYETLHDGSRIRFLPRPGARGHAAGAAGGGDHRPRPLPPASRRVPRPHPRRPRRRGPRRGPGAEPGTPGAARARRRVAPRRVIQPVSMDHAEGWKRAGPAGSPVIFPVLGGNKSLACGGRRPYPVHRPRSTRPIRPSPRNAPMLRFRHAAPRVATLMVCALAARPAAAQVQVSLRPLTHPEAFFVADLLPGSTGVRPDLIGITLVAERVGETVSLELTAARESPSPTQIFRGTTAPFVLSQPVRQVTSRDLATRGRDVSITDATVNEDALEGPSRTGRLPAGTYVFTVTVRNLRGEAIDDDQLRITFTSPSRVALLSPGAPADMPPPEVLGPTPRFLWSADGETPGARYRLRVVKVDAGAGSAVEALQSGFPAWDAIINGTSAFYPASSQALRLEPGATYAWQVTRELRTSGGTEPVESPIYWFRVGGPGVPGATGGTLELRFAALLRALGLTGLDGFTPVGATLEDGRPLPLDKLEELLTAIEAGEVSVLNVRVR